MKKLIVLSFVILFCITIKAQNDSKPDQSSLSQNLTETVVKNLKVFPENTQLSMVLIKPDGNKFIGFKKTADTLSGVDNRNQIFEIGSVTKVFTATLLSQLVQNQKIELNEPVSTYINIDATASKEITFQQLANHTSGLPRLPSNLDLSSVDPNNPYNAYDIDKLKTYLAEQLELLSKPGSVYQYSNLGAGLLGYSLTQVTQSSYEELLQDYIFSKYDMNNSTTDITKLRNDLVDGLNFNGEKTSNWDMNSLVAAGGIYSNVNDLSNFVLAQFNPQDEVLNLTRKKTFDINANMDIALGWHIINRPNEDNYLWHNGGTGGYTSSVAINLKDQKAVVILSNISAFHPKKSNIDKLVFELLGEI